VLKVGAVFIIARLKRVARSGLRTPQGSAKIDSLKKKKNNLTCGQREFKQRRMWSMFGWGAAGDTQTTLRYCAFLLLTYFYLLLHVINCTILHIVYKYRKKKQQ
jgi:hypothetical protein